MDYRRGREATEARNIASAISNAKDVKTVRNIRDKIEAALENSRFIESAGVRPSPMDYGVGQTIEAQRRHGAWGQTDLLNRLLELADRRAEELGAKAGFWAKGKKGKK